MPPLTKLRPGAQWSECGLMPAIESVLDSLTVGCHPRGAVGRLGAVDARGDRRRRPLPLLLRERLGDALAAWRRRRSVGARLMVQLQLADSEDARRLLVLGLSSHGERRHRRNRLVKDKVGGHHSWDWVWDAVALPRGGPHPPTRRVDVGCRPSRAARRADLVSWRFGLDASKAVAAPAGPFSQAHRCLSQGEAPCPRARASPDGGGSSR